MEKIRAYYQTTGRASVDYIVVHWINGSLESCVRTFTDGVRQASAHYGVEDDRLVSFVDDADTAWALGNWDANQRSISVEHSAQPGRPASDKTYKTSIRLIAGLMVKHDLKPSTETIRPHHDFSATQCPGTMDLARIIEGVKALLAEPATITEDEKMLIIARQKGTDEIFIGDAVTRRHVPNPRTLDDIRWAAEHWGTPKLFDGGKVQDVDNVEFIGKLV